MKTIGFKLGGEQLAALEERASRLGMTVHEFARKALLEKLGEDGGDVHRLTMTVRAMQGELSDLRKDLRVATHGVLVTAGRVAPEEAARFVRDKLGGGQKVLSIAGPMKGAGKGEYYLSLSREDYYLEGGEPPGTWQGEGAERLGLKGTVEAEQLRSLLAGYGPGGKPLLQNAGEEGRRSGWDFTYSAPKSVSTVWSQVGDEERHAIQKAHDRGVERANTFLEKEGGYIRTGKGGVDRERAGLVIAKFQHGTSRAQDPNLHTHCLVANVGVREDGKTASIDPRELYRLKMAAGAVYRAELAQELQRHGYAIERKKTYFEVGGVPEELTKEFSKRREAIEAALREKGYQSAKASEAAALSTRGAKEHQSREKLLTEWKRVGAEHGITEEKLIELKRGPGLPEDPVRVGEENTREAVKTITERESHFTRAELIRHAAQGAQGKGIGGLEAVEAADRYLKTSKEIVSLGTLDGEERYSTPEILAKEKALLETARARRAESYPVSEEAVTRSIERRTLNKEQAAAVRHITEEAGGIKLVSGMAGTGKSYMLGTAKEAWEAEGYTVLGAAPSGKASRELEKSSGIGSATIHRRLGQIERGEVALDKKTVFVVDEAGMVGTDLMSKIVSETEKRGAKLVLIGDEKQLQAIDSGGAFKAFSSELGRAELTDIRRQKEEWAQKAVSDFAYGKADEALSEYAKRGLVAVEDDQHQTRAKLLSDWKRVGIEAPERGYILTSTNLDAQILNEEAQAARYAAGKLGEASVKVAGAHIHEGDRVLFMQNSRKHGVNKGEVGTVESLDTRTGVLKVKIDGREERVTVPTKKYEELKLGYAMTTHKAQGSTVSETYVLLGGGMQDREMTYVQASRAQGPTRFYVNRDDAGEKLKGITKQMRASHQKDFALSLKPSNGMRF